MISFFAPGIPEPKGSMSVSRKARAYYQNARELAAWQTTVKLAATAAVAKHERATKQPWKPLDCALVVDVDFHFPMNQAHWGEEIHAVTPDGDKCMRAVNDAITGVVIRNDSRIFQGTFRKWWTPNKPGANVVVLPLEEFLKGGKKLPE